MEKALKHFPSLLPLPLPSLFSFESESFVAEAGLELIDLNDPSASEVTGTWQVPPPITPSSKYTFLQGGYKVTNEPKMHENHWEDTIKTQKGVASPCQNCHYQQNGKYPSVLGLRGFSPVGGNGKQLGYHRQA